MSSAVECSRIWRCMGRSNRCPCDKCTIWKVAACIQYTLIDCNITAKHCICIGLSLVDQLCKSIQFRSVGNYIVAVFIGLRCDASISADAANLIFIPSVCGLFSINSCTAFIQTNQPMGILIKTITIMMLLLGRLPDCIYTATRIIYCISVPSLANRFLIIVIIVIRYNFPSGKDIGFISGVFSLRNRPIINLIFSDRKFFRVTCSAITECSAVCIKVKGTLWNLCNSRQF